MNGTPMGRISMWRTSNSWNNFTVTQFVKAPDGVAKDFHIPVTTMVQYEQKIRNPKEPVMLCKDAYILDTIVCSRSLDCNSHN